MARRDPLPIPFAALDAVRRHQRAVAAAVTGTLLLYVAITLPTYPELTRFRAEALQALPSVLAPLVVIALFIERAVEVVLAAWRADGAQVRRQAMRRAMKGDDVDAQWAAKSACERYTIESQKIAFLISFVLAVLVSMMGIRAIEMLVSDDLVPTSPLAQQRLFVWVDVLVTALLLTGGAEGIHKVVNAFTTFLELTQKNLRQAGTDTEEPAG